MRLRGNTPRTFRGFSLVEIVLALGLVAISVIGILSVFPTALQTAKDSKVETRIAYIAESVMSELMSGTFAQVKVAERRQFLNQPYNGDTAAGDRNPISAYRTMNLANPQTVYFLFDNEGVILRAGTNAEYQNGTAIVAGEVPSIFVARLTTEYGSPGYPSGVALLQLSIETPAGAAEAKRKKYAFATLRGDW